MSRQKVIRAEGTSPGFGFSYEPVEIEVPFVGKVLLEDSMRASRILQDIQIEESHSDAFFGELDTAYAWLYAYGFKSLRRLDVIKGDEWSSYSDFLCFSAFMQAHESKFSTRFYHHLVEAVERLTYPMGDEASSSFSTRAPFRLLTFDFSEAFVIWVRDLGQPFEKFWDCPMAFFKMLSVGSQSLQEKEKRKI